MLKRFLAALVIFVTLPCCALAASAELPMGEEARIMIVADIQDSQFPVSFFLPSYLAAIEEQQPDLVIFLGDNVCGYHPFLHIGDNAKNVAAAIDLFCAPLEERGIPFAVVFGNHDAQSGVSKEDQLAIYQSYGNCLSYDADEALTGCGACHITLTREGEGVANLFLFDSLEEDGMGGYGCVPADQVEWYEESSLALEEEYGKKLPAFAFQHIVIPEIYETLIECEKGDPGAHGGKGLAEGRYYLFESDYLLSGGLMEAPAPGHLNGGEFDAWRSRGDVIAAFFGHDHVNDFVIRYGGIDLINCPGASYSSYGAREMRGIRMLNIKASDPAAYESYTVRFSEYEEGGFFSELWYHISANTFLPGAAKIAIIVIVIAAAVIVPLRVRSKKKKKS